MTERIFDIDVNFLENCNYNASSISKEISLPLQKPDITVQVVNEDQQYYYNDIVTISASVNYDGNSVTNGTIDFYYINDNEAAGNKHLINEEPIDLDKYGNANIQFIPYKDCEVVAIYNGEPYFDNVESNAIIGYTPCKIALNSIPTAIRFKNSPPHFVNPQEDVKLDVEVFDVRDPNNPQPLDYGIVTFAHYDIFDINDPGDGQEHIIGNPVYLIDGQASIKYSPVQEQSDSHSQYNIELIRAVYNFPGNLYGVEWRKYYDMDSTYTSIALLKPNNININTNMSVRDGMFYANTEDPAYLKFTITNEDGEPYTFQENSQLKIYIKKYFEEESPVVKFAQYIYDEEINDYCFKCLVNDNIDTGLYYAYAVALDEHDNYLGNKDTLIVDDPQQITNVDGKDIKDYIYLQSLESQHIYFTVEAVQKDYEINFESSQADHILLERQEPLKLRVTLSSATDPYFNTLLEGKNCYFQCSTLGQTYSSVIQKENEQLYAELDIIKEVIYEDDYGQEHTRLEHGIPINTEYNNDYIFYAYIDTATYHTNEVSRQYVKRLSSAFTLKVRHEPSLELFVQTLNSTYPGKAKYTIVGTNIYYEDIPISLTIDDDVNNDSISLTLNQDNNVLSGYLENLLPTEDMTGHTIKIENNTYNLYDTATTNAISKGALDIILNNYSNEVIASKNTSIVFIVQESSNNNIKQEEVFTDNLTITATKDDLTLTAINTNIESMTNNIINLIANLNLCDDGEWTIQLTYAGNDLYVPINDIESTLNVVRYEPTITFQKNEFFDIYYNMSNAYGTHNNEKVLVIATFTKDDNNKEKIITITDNQGKCVFEKPAQFSIQDWHNYYSNFTIEINPHMMLDTFSNADVDTIIDDFTAYFNPNDHIQCTNEDIVQLFYQFKDNYELCLFTGYDAITESYEMDIDVLEEVEDGS